MLTSIFLWHKPILIMKKICVITGGSSGIGLSIAKLFSDSGYQVHNLDIQPSDIGIYHNCDVSDFHAVQDAISKIVSQENKIDILISNAGVHYSATIEATSTDDFDRIVNLNVKGAFAAVQAVLPSMKQQKNGVILFISSDQALVAKPNSFIYNLSKTALASMAKTTAIDYAKYNIRANAICPGTIETPLYHQAIDRYCEKSGANKAEIHQEECALQPLGRLGQADEVAQLALYLASDNASFITGSLQVIDGGYTAQ